MEAGAHLPIIAVTANTLKGDRETCISAGMTDYVTKRVNWNALWAKLAVLREDKKQGAG